MTTTTFQTVVAGKAHRIRALHHGSLAFWTAICLACADPGHATAEAAEVVAHAATMAQEEIAAAKAAAAAEVHVAAVKAANAAAAAAVPDAAAGRQKTEENNRKQSTKNNKQSRRQEAKRVATAAGMFCSVFVVGIRTRVPHRSDNVPHCRRANGGGVC